MKFLAIIAYVALTASLVAAVSAPQEPRQPAATSASIPTVVGVWEIKARQRESTVNLTLELRQAGGALEGIIRTPEGRMQTLSDVSFSGDVLKFTAVTEVGTFQVEGRLDYHLVGTYTVSGAKDTWEAKRTGATATTPAGNPFTSAVDVELGRKYFLGHCALCHGPDGEGGRGANLTTGQFRHGGSDLELFRTIQNGVPGTEMSGTEFSETEVWRIVAYVRRLAAAGAEEKAAGDVAAGRLIYQTQGACAACHVVDREGGVLGPDLSDIGLRRSLKYLRQALIEPDAYVAENYRTYTLTTQRGEQITGVRLNEDEYSIQLRDARGILRSFQKRNLRDWKRETRSLMPAYGSTLSAAEMENLLAYLSSLRRKP